MNYILYHNNCADGFGAAFCTWLKFRDTAKYIPCDYNKPFPVTDLTKEDEVYILDFSFKRDILLEVNSKVRKLLVLDHHLTAEQELKGLPFCTFDKDLSGAKLAFNYFISFDYGISEPQYLSLISLINYIEDRDLWRFNISHSKEFNAALRMYPMNFDVWYNLINTPYFTDTLIKEGEVCLRIQTQQVESALKSHHFAEILLREDHAPQLKIQNNKNTPFALEGELYTAYRIPVVNTSLYMSECCDSLLKLYPEAKFVGYYFTNSQAEIQFGLRSRANFDCSVVAKAFGGGGHKQACGFQLKAVNQG